MPDSHGAPTIARIASVLGVSQATVSRALNRPELLSPRTVQRVREAARQLGYSPNRAARALSTGQHRNIALIVPDIANPFFPPLIRAAQLAAEAADFCVFLGDSGETAPREETLAVKLAAQAAGVVLVSPRSPAERICELARRRPLVLVNRDVQDVPRVLINTTGGMRDAVAHLAGLGHERLAYVAGPAKSWSNQQRRKAARQAAEQHGLQLPVIAAGDPTYAAGEKVTGRILDDGCTAVIAFDDLVALGILGGLASRGVAVPDEFSVVGCDDTLGSISNPPLTTIAAPAMDAGRVAIELLLRVLENGTPGDDRYSLDSRLVVRSTTGPARARGRASAS
ncbi:MAG TPA: LacI family DNA-binding transcriptional regulator [Streptosporangiaceae bacterium]|nr:LacI family DNA-binding transcriptional regulator [Streptosporangiaceae bacterium]